jgi:hypothetical protein
MFHEKNIYYTEYKLKQRICVGELLGDTAIVG